VKKYRERQAGLVTSLVAQVEEKLEELSLLTAENEMLHVRGLGRGGC
jgi:hypothetical protein